MTYQAMCWILQREIAFKQMTSKLHALAQPQLLLPESPWLGKKFLGLVGR